MPESDRPAPPAPTRVLALSEVLDFLRAHAPFDGLPEDELQRVSAATEVEFHPAGETIFSPGDEPVRELRVVRTGAVELVLDDRLLDRLESGELFGHDSMLSGLPAGFEARAAEDTLCYRIPGPAARELLGRPQGLRYVARSLLDRSVPTGAPARPGALGSADQPVSGLIRGEPVVCEPDVTIREAAQRMTAAGQTSILVRLAGGGLGILTDHDLRTRVVAAGLDGEAPVTSVMSAPAYTCAPDRPAGEVLLDMLDRGIRHFPVVAATGEVLGVVSDSDLVVVERRSSFHLRRAIRRAATVEALVAAARDLRPTVIALHEARVGAEAICAIHTIVVDALTRRLLELATEHRPDPAPAFAWLALGSQARREATPGSDVDSAIVWFEGEEEQVRPVLEDVGEEVAAALDACGLPRDPHRATAGDALFVRSAESWQRAVRSWLSDPGQEKAVLLVSVLLDSRPVWGVHRGTPIADTFASAPRDAALHRLLARMAVAHRPPTGFLRGLVVEHSGEHRGQLDLKRGGVLPIVDLARWAGFAAGVKAASTRERLRAGASAGTLPEAEARDLEEAFDLIGEVRLAHQVDQLRRGVEPDDHVDPAALSPLTRSHLKESFRAIASVQKHVSGGLTMGVP